MRYHNGNVNNVKNILIKNGYPIKLLKLKIAKYYETITESKNTNKQMIDLANQKKIIVTPYISHFDKVLLRIFNKKSNIQIFCASKIF